MEIARGAESVLILEKGILIKRRIKKGYRIKEIDEFLRKHRTKVEAKMLKKAGQIVNVPKIISVEKFEIKMEYIDAPVLRDVINEVDDKILRNIGEIIAKLHSKDIIHGDLTTSNFLLKNNQLILIDFGLSEVKTSIEAKAVDLHVLKEAIKSKHYNIFRRAWPLIEEGYKTYDKAELVLKRLKVVESRGRYKKK